MNEKLFFIFFCFIISLAVSEVSLYLWGSNVNMTLGHDRSRSNPELVEATPPLGNVEQVRGY